MNRRELAKNGFLALCGALFGKKAEKPLSGVCLDFGLGPIPIEQVVKNKKMDYVAFEVSYSADTEDEGYSLSDGTEIEHG